MWLFQLIVFLIILTILAVSIGKYMAKVFNHEKLFLSHILEPFENLIYKLIGTDANTEMSWKTYTVSLITLNGIGMVILFLIQLVQHWFPLNPQGFKGVRWDTAINTAVSFVTNTNWQTYSGESTMSYFTQMFGLAVQNFLSAATGIAAAIALMRGFHTLSLVTFVFNIFVYSYLTRSGPEFQSLYQS